MRTRRPPMTPLRQRMCGRHAAPQLLCAYDARVSALCRRFRPAFSDLPRAPRPGAGPHLSALSRPGQTARLAHRGPDRLCAALLLPGHPETPDDAGVYRASAAPLHAADHPQPSRSRAVTDRPTQPETPRHPHHALCGGAAGVRTVPVAGHGYRQRAHGPPGAARQRPARSVCHALAEIAPVVTAVLAAGQTAALALSRPSPHAPDDHQGRVSGLPAAPGRPRTSRRRSTRMCFVTPLRRISSKRGWICGGSNSCWAIGACARPAATSMSPRMPCTRPRAHWMRCRWTTPL